MGTIFGSRGVLLTVLLAAVSMTPVAAADASAAALDRFKALAGAWEGANAEGQPVKIVYEVVADGSAVLEKLEVGDHGVMVTLYHLDGGRLMLTHYCIAGNQPRMRAVPADADEVRFEFLDATGLASAGAGHMHQAVFRFDGEDRLSSQWSWYVDGKKDHEASITVERIAGI